MTPNPAVNLTVIMLVMSGAQQPPMCSRFDGFPGIVYMMLVTNVLNDIAYQASGRQY